MRMWLCVCVYAHTYIAHFSPVAYQHYMCNTYNVQTIDACIMYILATFSFYMLGIKHARTQNVLRHKLYKVTYKLLKITYK